MLNRENPDLLVDEAFGSTNQLTAGTSDNDVRGDHSGRPSSFWPQVIADPFEVGAGVGSNGRRAAGLIAGVVFDSSHLTIQRIAYRLVRFYSWSKTGGRCHFGGKSSGRRSKRRRVRQPPALPVCGVKRIFAGSTRRFSVD